MATEQPTAPRPGMYQLHHEEPWAIPEGRATLQSLDAIGEWVPGEATWLEHDIVWFDVVEPEDVTFSGTATQYPVEDGRNISDHVSLQPVTVELTGVLVGRPSSHERLAILRKWQRRRDRLRYVGRNIFGKYVITNLNTVHSYRTRDGLAFNVTLTEVRQVQPKVADTVADDPGDLPPESTGSGGATATATVVSEETGIASWYGGKWHGRKTANGETYDQNSMTAAHKTLPFNARVEVERVSTGAKVVVRINNRGPFISGRIIDLSVAAAKALGMYEAGITQVIVRRLG